MSGANSQTRNRHVQGVDNYADVRPTSDNAQQKHADLAQWQSSGFVNSRESSSAQGQEHSEIGRGEQAHGPTEQPEQSRRVPYANDPAKARARSMVRRAVKAGRLVRPPRCEHCNKKSKEPLAAHHTDGYEGDNALKVRWFCRPCHVYVHHPEYWYKPGVRQTPWKELLKRPHHLDIWAVLNGIDRSVLGEDEKRSRARVIRYVKKDPTAPIFWEFVERGLIERPTATGGEPHAA